MPDDTKVFELKVGLFILIGLIILFIIVFSIGDMYLFKKGYHLRVVFNFANGLAESAPVRLAGVQVGEVKSINIYYDTKEERTKVELDVSISKDVRIEKDSEPMINTLGLLGEKYLEIFPGRSKTEFVAAGDTLIGHDPIPVETITEDMGKLLTSVNEVFDKIKNGDGTISRLLNDGSMYTSIEGLTTDMKGVATDIRRFMSSANEIADKVKTGNGTIGKLIYEDKLYDDLGAFVEDIKNNPWKLLHKPKESKKK